MEPKRLLTVLCIGLTSFSLAACANFSRLNKDLKRAKNEPSISGTIFRGTWTGKPVKIYLFQKAEDREFPLLFRSILLKNSPSDYKFRVPEPGRYLVGAFEDQNDDGRFSDGEPVATVNDFEYIDVAEGQKLHDQNMELGADIPPRLMQMRHERIKMEALVEHGTRADLEDPKFGPESGPLGMWQPLVFLDRYGAGLYMLQKYDPKKFPVLFIHGMSGYPREFATLIAGLDKDTFQPWILHYPSGIRLAQAVRGVQAALDLTLRDLETTSEGEIKVLLVAHSMGGLIAHQWLREAYSMNRQQSLACLITIASPLGGMPSADTGVKHAPAVVPSWRDVGPNSQFVLDLFKLPFPEEVPYDLYFGYGGSVTFGRNASDGTVRLESQLRREAQDIAWRLSGYNATHTGILELPEVSERLNEDLASCARRLTTAAAQKDELVAARAHREKGSSQPEEPQPSQTQEKQPLPQAETRAGTP